MIANVGMQLCSRDGLTAGAYLPDAQSSKCGSWLACDDGMTAKDFYLTPRNPYVASRGVGEIGVEW